jgi:hypothetical protein
MESNSYNRQAQAGQRHLSSLKLVSRLLGHELHAQGASKTITLSREEVVEIQSTLDLFIEEMSRRQGGQTAGSSSDNTRMVTARN